MLDLSNGSGFIPFYTVSWFLTYTRYSVECPKGIKPARWNAMLAQYVSNYAFLVCMDD